MPQNVISPFFGIAAFSKIKSFLSQKGVYLLNTKTQLNSSTLSRCYKSFLMFSLLNYCKNRSESTLKALAGVWLRF